MTAVINKEYILTKPFHHPAWCDTCEAERFRQGDVYSRNSSDESARARSIAICECRKHHYHSEDSFDYSRNTLVCTHRESLEASTPSKLAASDVDNMLKRATLPAEILSQIFTHLINDTLSSLCAHTKCTPRHCKRNPVRSVAQSSKAWFEEAHRIVCVESDALLKAKESVVSQLEDREPGEPVVLEFRKLRNSERPILVSVVSGLEMEIKFIKNERKWFRCVSERLDENHVKQNIEQPPLC